MNTRNGINLAGYVAQAVYHNYARRFKTDRSLNLGPFLCLLQIMLIQCRFWLHVVSYKDHGSYQFRLSYEQSTNLFIVTWEYILRDSKGYGRYGTGSIRYICNYFRI